MLAKGIGVSLLLRRRETGVVVSAHQLVRWFILCSTEQPHSDLRRNEQSDHLTATSLLALARQLRRVLPVRLHEPRAEFEHEETSGPPGSRLGKCSCQSETEPAHGESDNSQRAQLCHRQCLYSIMT